MQYRRRAAVMECYRLIYHPVIEKSTASGVNTICSIFISQFDHG